LGKGPKRGQQQAAIVTGLYTIAPSWRTPQEVVAALRREPGGPEGTRPAPVEKELRATLEGKAVAITRLVRRVAPRQGPQSEPRVAWTDGAEALPQQLRTPGPGHTLVWAILHATE
jgi:hypothetical protein